MRTGLRRDVGIAAFARFLRRSTRATGRAHPGAKTGGSGVFHIRGAETDPRGAGVLNPSAAGPGVSWLTQFFQSPSNRLGPILSVFSGVSMAFLGSLAGVVRALEATGIKGYWRRQPGATERIAVSL
jgi:hypothetical protein